MALINNVEPSLTYANYAYIRTYTGAAESIEVRGGMVAGDGAAGTFVRTAEPLVDDGATVLVDALGRSWVRLIGESYNFDWWVPAKDASTDVLPKLNAAASAAANARKPLYLSGGFYAVSDEFVPPNGLSMHGYGNSLRAGNTYATVLRWIGGVRERTAVIRCSRSPIATTPTEDVSGVRITNITVDANNQASTGIYCRYFTNESYLDQITAIGARIVGIAIYQTWFSSFGALLVHDNYGRGMVVGYPTQGETGNLAVNSCNFLRIRTHTNGLRGDFVPTAGSPTRYSGAGLITRSSACTYSNIQSERNFGFGWIETSPRSGNSYGSYYTEFNGVSDGSNGYGFLSPDETGALKSVVIDNVTLYSREAFINEADTPVSIGNFTKALDAFNSVFSGPGGFRILGGAAVAATAYQSESDFATTLRSIPYTVLRTDFNLASTSSLSSGLILPPGVTRVMVQLMYHQSTPAGTYTLRAGITDIAYYNEGAHNSGDVVTKFITLPSNVSRLTLSATSLTGTIPCTLQVVMGRFNNGDYAKIPSWTA